MGLLENIRNSIASFTSDTNGFASEATFINQDGETATMNVLHTKHHEDVDGNGLKVIGKRASVAFSEIKFTELNPGYAIRNANGEVDLTGHRINVKDSTGVLKYYSVKSWQPDEMVGLIVVFLDDYSD